MYQEMKKILCVKEDKWWVQSTVRSECLLSSAVPVSEALKLQFMSNIGAIYELQ